MKLFRGERGDKRLPVGDPKGRAGSWRTPYMAFLQGFWKCCRVACEPEAGVRVFGAGRE